MEPVYQVHPPSSIIQAELPDGRIISGPRGEPVGQFLAQISGEFDREPVEDIEILFRNDRDRIAKA